MEDDEFKIDDITIDLGNMHISGGSSTDYLDMSSYTYTLPSTVSTNSTYTIANGTWGNGVSTITSSPYITTTTNPGISVQGDAEFTGNIKVKGKDLSEWMDAIERRLSILVPNPKKLEHYEALQKAYNHYKMLEALCEEPDDKTE